MGETRTSYEYDADGFLTKKVQGASPTDYRYSSRGELLEVVLPDGRVLEYVHDPLGRRIAKKVNGMLVEKYLWQGMTRLLAVYDGNDNMLMRFEYADDRVPMAMTRGGVVYYLTYDQVGTLRAVVDGAGNIVKRIDYDSFGNILYDSNPGFAMPFGFAGGLHDRDTGLVRFGFRDYDPDIGRWTAKDPILFAGGSSDLYGYCMNDPVNFEDPFGLALTERQRLIVSVAGSMGAVVGGIAVGATTWGIGTPVGAAVGGALFSAAAASLLGGDLAEVGSAFVSNLAAGYLGAGIGSLMYSISTTALQASLRTGALAGALKALMFESDPLFDSGGLDSASPCMK